MEGSCFPSHEQMVFLKERPVCKNPAPAFGRGGIENTKNNIFYEAQALPTSASGAQPV